MTKNKSLFSGVGDGNRVKSIRLQGDKHTQGKKGEKKNCECGKAGPNREPPPSCQAWEGEGGGDALGQQEGQSWGPVVQLQNQTTAWAADPGRSRQRD